MYVKHVKDQGRGMSHVRSVGPSMASPAQHVTTISPVLKVLGSRWLGCKSAARAGFRLGSGVFNMKHSALKHKHCWVEVGASSV